MELGVPDFSRVAWNRSGEACGQRVCRRRGRPRDEESAALWRECGLPAERIFYLPKKNNWWGPAGQTGPCGPDTEMFIVRDQAPCGPSCSPACDCGRYLEIWNDVFMQYNKKADGTFEPLRQRNVDTGMGLERTITVLQGKNSVYEMTCSRRYWALSGSGRGMASPDITRAMRIVNDHIRTATFILGDPKACAFERRSGLCATPHHPPGVRFGRGGAA